jgi:hypothetical protein
MFWRVKKNDAYLAHPPARGLWTIDPQRDAAGFYFLGQAREYANRHGAKVVRVTLRRTQAKVT